LFIKRKRDPYVRKHKKVFDKKKELEYADDLTDKYYWSGVEYFPKNRRILYYGATKLPSSGHGELTVPTTRWYKRLLALYPQTKLVSEYLTTKICHFCFKRMASVELNYSEDDKKKYWTIRDFMWCSNQECQEKWRYLYDKEKVKGDFNQWLPKSKTPKEFQESITAFRTSVAHNNGFADRDVNAAMNIGLCGWREAENQRPFEFTKENSEEKKASYIIGL